MSKPEQPRVAVIMSVYNEQASWLSACIESILSQTWSNLLLYITLDDPSNRELNDLIEEYAAIDERIVYKRNEKNIGLIASLNNMIGAVGEQYIARMDADDVAVPQRIEVEMREMIERNLDFVMGGIDFISEDNVCTSGRLFPRLQPEDIAELQKYANVSAHPTWLLKAEVYEKLNGYRDVANCEDLDFLMRSLQEGFRVGYVPRVMVNYRLRDSSVSTANILSQDMKAELLREKYANDIPISSNDVLAELQGIDAAVPDIEVGAASDAKRNLDRFTAALYEKRIGECLLIALRNYAFDGEFRRRFNVSLGSRVKTHRILRRAKRRS